MTNGAPRDNASLKQAVKGPSTRNRSVVLKSWSFAVALVVVTLIAYLPGLRGGFVWDDEAWTSNISGLLRDFSGLRLMWCKLTALQQYYPLTGTTFWLDYHLWGFWPLPYHVENVFLHALAALLFWQLLRRLDVAGAWLAAAIFALHPVMVESVGWITERKNVLSLVFYLGALLAYGRFVSFWKEDNDSAPSNDSPPRWRAYSFALLLALGALLAKTTTFSLPAVILLICWWKRGRIRWRADVLPTLPFFALAIGLCVVTAWLEKNYVGAQGPEFAMSFPEQCLVAGQALWFYVGKLLWPVNLCFVYPRWHLNAGSGLQWLYPISAVGALFTLWLARKQIGRAPAAAAFFFVGTLFPVLGFMSVYGMLYSFVWDHWVYLSSLGLIALAAALVAQVTRYLRTPAVLYGFAAVILPLLTVLTWRQGAVYNDVETLWRDTLARNPDCWMAEINLGMAFLQTNKPQEAIPHFEQALRIKPNYAEAHYNVGTALLQMSRPQEAIARYEQALRIKPNYFEAHYNAGNAFLQINKPQEAIAHYEQALRIKPNLAEAHYNAGNAFLQMSRPQEAIAHFEQALRLKPNFAETENNLGMAFLQINKPREAIAHFEQALRLKPNFAEAENNLGNAFLQMNKPQEAIVHFEQALRLKPNYTKAENNLAWLLATLPQAEGGNPARAVSLAEQACELTSNRLAGNLDTLAVAYGAAGRFTDAIATSHKAIELAHSAGRAELVREIEARLELYRNGRAYRPSLNPVRGETTDMTNPHNP